MGNSNNSWEKIQQGVKETERLIGQKEYNTSMIKSRQTLEYMVKQLIERAGILESGDLKNQIDLLYQNNWISKQTCEHYHKIRIIGNKAVHEGDSNAYSANQAYHILSQEVVAFSTDYRNAPKGIRSPQGRTQTQQNRPSQRPRSRSRSQSTRRSTSRSRRQTRSQIHFTPYDLLKLLIPVLCIILLFLIVKLIKPDHSEPEISSIPTTTSVVETSPAETIPTETMAPVSYRTTDVLNVRSGPDTSSEKLGKLASGTAVEYVRAYNEEWAIIRYNGQEAYVASRYLTTQ